MLPKFITKLSPEMIYTIVLIIYVSILSVYTPRSWLSLINHSYVKFAILMYILYVIVFDEDIVLGIFMVVAFVITITLDNSIQAAKITYDVDMERKELFTNKEEDVEELVNDEDDDEKMKETMSDKTIKDTFQNLHESIHELQKMMKENKK